MKNYIVLYIHGMGGGSDSRIPSVLAENIGRYAPGDTGIDIIVRTYDIDPDIAVRQISSWVEELGPALVVGESLGAVHAVRIPGVPHLLVSPAVGAARWMALASYVPFAPILMRRMFRTRPGDRQALDFTRDVLRHYRGVRKKALSCASSGDCFFAFFGTRDTYRRWGVVSMRSWKRHFGDACCAVYDGTHYMEEEYLLSMLIPEMLRALGLDVSGKNINFMKTIS